MLTLQDTTTRDRLLFGDTPPNYSGGVAYFKGIRLETLKTLQQIGCLDPEDSFNCSPEAGEFMRFMEGERLNGHPEVTAHGYAYHPDRFKEVGGILHSINIEGIECRARKPWPGILADETIRNFVLAFRHADDFEWEPDRLYCWYD